jgi:uncharacterized protein YdeI (YjbR/CyaY-like superfamily)
MNQSLSSGVVHELPQDIEEYILSSQLEETWEKLTPLARNEWICWISSAKKEETREKRKDWMCSDLKKGKKRPCCWPGCSHRS